MVVKLPTKNHENITVEAVPLTPYPERNDERVETLERFLAALEDAVAEHDKTLEEYHARLAHVEALLYKALNPEPAP